MPPFNPAQLQAQGPVPVTVEALPAEQRLVVGAVGTVVPFADPQAPFTGVGSVVVIALAEAADTLPAASKAFTV